MRSLCLTPTGDHWVNSAQLHVPTRIVPMPPPLATGDGYHCPTHLARPGGAQCLCAGAQRRAGCIDVVKEPDAPPAHRIGLRCERSAYVCRALDRRERRLVGGRTGTPERRGRDLDRQEVPQLRCQDGGLVVATRALTRWVQRHRDEQVTLLQERRNGRRQQRRQGRSHAVAAVVLEGVDGLAQWPP